MKMIFPKSFIRKNGVALSIAAGAAVGLAGAAFAVVRYIASRRRRRLEGPEVPYIPEREEESVAESGTEAWAPPMVAGGSEEFAGMRRDRRTHRREANPREPA